MVKLSVIIPIYNAEKTLSQCVTSVLNQEFRDFELILVDDGSTDSSLALCQEYKVKDSRIVLLSQKNGGVSSARNLGLQVACGEWVTFIDSDDYIEKGFFTNVETFDADIVFTSFYRLNSEGKIKDTFEVKQVFKGMSLHDVLSLNLSYGVLRVPWGKFYRRDLIGELRFPERMKIGEDAYFLLTYLSRCISYGMLPDSKYVFRLPAELDEVKYAVTIDYAMLSLGYLKDAFEQLRRSHVLSKSLFLTYIAYFKRISINDRKHQSSKWYKNVDVLAYYKYIWPSLTFFQKIRIVISFILKR